MNPMKKTLLLFACLASLSTLHASTLPVGVAPRIQTGITEPVDLKQYTGKYKFEGLPFEFMTIAVKDDSLTVDTGSESGLLTPVKDATDQFNAGDRAVLKFTRDENKKVTGLTLEAQGMSFYGKREP